MFSSKEIKGKSTLMLIQEVVDNILERDGTIDRQFARMIQSCLTEPNYIEQTLDLLKKLHDFCDKGILKNNVRALFLKAYLYRKGFGCKQNTEQAIEILDKAVANHYVPALRLRADIHIESERKNISEGIRLLNLLAEKGDMEAITYLGDIHLDGLAGKVNYSEAVRLYDKAITLGDSFAMYKRAMMHLKGKGGEKRIDDAMTLLKDAAILGCPDAMTELGDIYNNFNAHNEVPSNHSEAITLYDDAIILGNKWAMNNRAFMYLEGLGGLVNYSEAIKLYEKAIALGGVQALHNRALMHEQGLGGEINLPEALRLYDDAISNNYLLSIYNYARILISHPSFPRKHVPERLLRKAAEGGHKDAKILLGQQRSSKAHYHSSMLSKSFYSAAHALICYGDHGCISEFLEYDCRNALNDETQVHNLNVVFDTIRGQFTYEHYRVIPTLIESLKWFSSRREELKTVSDNEFKIILQMEIKILDSFLYDHLHDNDQANFLLDHIVELYDILESEIFIEKASQYISAILRRLKSLSLERLEIPEVRNIATILVKNLLGPETEVILSPFPISTGTLFFLCSLKELDITLNIEKINDFLERPLLTSLDKREQAKRRREAFQDNQPKNSASPFFTKACIVDRNGELPRELKHQLLS